MPAPWYNFDSILLTLPIKTTTMTNLQEGEEAPEIHGEDQNGEVISFDRFEGKSSSIRTAYPSGL